ncbi:MAG TPA: diguanylate cyclase [Acidimicrobiales bacterium]|nr:diguanylate cyclase [Acidimicrobiales bacterium]
MLRREASADGVAPPPPSVFFQGLLDSLPALLMVIDAAGTIRYVAGHIDRLGERNYADLIGSPVADFVATPEERVLVEELVTITGRRAQGEMVGPVLLPYLDPDGTVRLTQAWAVNRAKEPGTGVIVVVLLPESAYDRFDQVLSAIVKDVSLEETLASLAEALGHMPVMRECYFLRPGPDDRGLLRSPERTSAPGPPSPGPWDEIWAGAASVECESLSQLSSALREQARATGFASVACFAVHPGPEGHADACLVAWSREEGRMTPFARLALERAILIASLAMSYRSEDEGLRDAALRDPLTGLGNRRSFFQALEVLVAAGEQPAILYIDLDGFKAINDNLGHLAGDAVLRVVARRLASVMRPTDELARLGGDEFAVLCNGSPSGEQMVMIAQRVVEQLSRPLSVGDGETVDVGASIGIAQGLPVGTPVDTILGRADRALYEAKGKGKGQWAFATMA